MNIYLLSGLGADARAFQFFTLSPKYTCIHIMYVEPTKKETLQQYAFRITQQMDTSKPFAIIGLSFGGILAMEIIEYIQPLTTILISSITNKTELPILYKIAGAFKLNKLIPPKKVNKANWLTYWMFGIKKQHEKALLQQILTSSSTNFSVWAVNEILQWKRKIIPPNIYRIHGTRDKILPITNFAPDYKIKNAGHLLVLQYGDEVSKVVEQHLKQLENELF
jgi:hypothetical protein